MASSRVVRISGTGTPIRGEDIDTDRIVPARYLRTVTFEGLEHHLFEDERAFATRSGAVHPIDDPAYAGASVLVVGRNFGCGSSREHAPQAILRAGFRAVLGESFSGIFFGNAVAIGLPCLSASERDIARTLTTIEAHPATPITLAIDTLTATIGDDQFTIGLPAYAHEAFVSGTWDATGALLADFDQVEAVARRLPYVSAFAE